MPEPVGPVTRMMPCGRLIQSANVLQLVVVEAEAGEVLDQHLGVEDAHDHLLAEGGGQRGDAQLDLLPVALGLDAAVLRPALLGDVHAAHRLEARGDGQVDELRHAWISCSTPSMRKRMVACSRFGSMWMSEARES